MSAKPVRLVATLSGAGAIAGLLLVAAFQWAEPRILAHKAGVLQAAIHEVLAGPARTETLFVYENKLVNKLPAGVDSLKLERIYTGYDGDGRRIGFALLGAEPGFADIITLIVGYDAVSHQVVGMKVLDNKETPGLGDLIVKDSGFVAGFRARTTPIRGVKGGSGKGSSDEVDMITGATISSRVVISIINHRLEKMVPLIEAYLQENGS